MKYKMAFFDLDGTVLDSIAGLAISMNATRVSFGLPEQPQDLLQSFVGNGIRKLIERSTAKESNVDRDALYAGFMKYYGEHCVELTKPYEGIPEMLKTIRSAGLMTAISTNKPDAPSHDLIDALLPDLFDHVQGQIDGIPLKPDPVSVLSVCAKFGVDPSECVYIGDSEVDIAMGRNCGMDMISVDWGFKTHEFLVKNNSPKIVSSVGELIECLIG